MDRQEGKIAAVQLLRAVAAGVVAVYHTAFAYADHIGSGLGLARGNGHAGQVAVALFFVVSGYIMVVSSRRLFAAPSATRVFWTRRCIRILPPYWLATGLLVAVLLFLGREVDGPRLASSLALLPSMTVDFAGRPEFLLWPGWTLFYEMVFYLLFGLGLRWGRVAAIGIATAGIFGLVAAGAVFAMQSGFTVAMTRPVLLIFLVGLGLAALRERGHSLAPVLRWFALILGVLAMIAIPVPEEISALGFHYVLWAGFPAALFAAAVLGGPLKIPHTGLVNRLGDASYALYLLHVPLAMLAISLFPLRFGAWAYLLLTLTGIYFASLLAFRFVERPVTNWLNRHLNGRPRKDRLLEETGV